MMSVGRWMSSHEMPAYFSQPSERRRYDSLIGWVQLTSSAALSFMRTYVARGMLVPGM